MEPGGSPVLTPPMPALAENEPLGPLTMAAVPEVSTEKPGTEALLLPWTPTSRIVLPLHVTKTPAEPPAPALTGPTPAVASNPTPR